MRAARFRLEKYLTIPVLAIIVLMIMWGALAVALRYEYDGTLDEARSDSTAASRIFAERAGRLIRQADQIVQFVRFQENSTGDPAVINRLLQDDALVSRDIANVVLVTDAQGNVIASSGLGVQSKDDPGSNIGERKFFNDLASDPRDRLVIAIPVMGKITHRWSFQVARPLRDSAGHFRGAVVIALNPFVLANYYDDSVLGDKGVLGLLGDDHQFRFLRVDDAVWTGAGDATALLPGSNVTSEQPRVLTGPQPGMSRIVSYTKLEGLPLYAVAGLSEDEALGAYRFHRTLYAWLLSVGSALVLFGMWLGLRGTRRDERTRKRAQSAQDAMRAAIDGSLDAFYLLRAVRDDKNVIVDFEYVHLNLRGAEQLGGTVDGLTGLRMSVFEPGFVQSSVFDKYVRVVQTGEALEEEIQVDGQNLKAAWLHHVLVRVDDGLAIISRDITERKKVEVEMRADRAFLRTLFENLPVLVYAKSLRPETFGNILMWNQAAEITTGYKSADVIGSTDAGIFPPDIAHANEQFARAMLSNPMIREIDEERLVRRDGTVRLLHIIAVPVFDDAEKPDFYLGIAEDVTARTEQAHELEDKSAQLQAVNDASPLGLFRADVHGNLTYINRTIQRWSGVTPAANLNATWRHAIHPVDEKVVVGHWVNMVRARKRYEATYRLIGVDGATVWIDVKAAPLIVRGEVTGYIGTMTDITSQRELMRSRAMLVSVLESSSDFVATSRPDGSVLYLNPASRHVRGLPLDFDVTQTVVSDHFPKSVVRRLAQEIVPAATRDGVWVGDTFVYDGEGNEVPVNHMVIVHKDSRGEVEFISSIMRDVSGTRAAEEAVRQSEARLKTITDTLPMLISYIDANERYCFVNRAYENRFRMSREQILTMTMKELRGDEEYEEFRPHLQTAFAGEVVIYEEERRENGRFVCRQVTYIPEADATTHKVVGIYVVVQDITDVKISERRLRKLAEVDVLTSLVNRAAFEHRLSDVMEASRQNSSWLGLLYLDIDYFKKVNDVHGHAVGDALLKAFAARVRACCRGTDLVARMGGDEFAVIAAPIQQPEHIDTVARKILDAVRVPFSIEGLVLNITTSIGVTLYRGTEEMPERLVRDADEMLYEAKAAGRDRYCVSGRAPRLASTVLPKA